MAQNNMAVSQKRKRKLDLGVPLQIDTAQQSKADVKQYEARLTRSLSRYYQEEFSSFEALLHHDVKALLEAERLRATRVPACSTKLAEIESLQAAYTIKLETAKFDVLEALLNDLESLKTSQCADP